MAKPRTNYPRLASALGKRVFLQRQLAELSRAELSHALGKSPGYAAQVELGYIVPSLPMLYRLAKAVGCEVDELLPESPNARGAWA